MADWVNIIDSQVDPDAPLTSELAYAWRDNVVAMAEGAVGAPRIAPKARKSDILGSGIGSGTSPVGLSGIAAYSVIGIRAHGAGSYGLQISFSSDGTTWGSWQSIGALQSATNQFQMLDFELNLLTGAVSGFGSSLGNTTRSVEAISSAALTVPANCLAVRFRTSNSGTTWGFIISALEGRP